MDDTILIDNDNVKLEKLNKRLVHDFEIKDLGMLKYLFGMEFARAKEDIFVNPHKFVVCLVKQFCLVAKRLKHLLNPT